MDIKSQYYQEFIPAEKDRIKYELAKKYHDKTEAFDRTVCTGPIIDGAIMPASSYQSKVISQYACSLRHELFKEAQQYEITPKELRTAISHYRG